MTMKQTRAMSEKIDVPIICIDDDDEEDDLKIDNGYKSFLDHLTDDSSFGPLFIANESDLNRPRMYEADFTKSETRRFDTFSGNPKRANENPMKNRVSQQRKRETGGFKGEISRGFPITTTRENIQRDNRIAERRKRKMAELEASSVSSSVPLTTTRGHIQLENRVAGRRKRRVVELEAPNVPLVRNHESFPRDDRAGKLSELEDQTLGDTHLVRTEEDIQRDNKFAEQRKRRVVEFKASRVSRDVPLVRNHESFPRDKRVGKFSELEDETLGDTHLVRTEEDIQRDNKFAEQRKRRVTELKAPMVSRDVPLVRNHLSFPRDDKVGKLSELDDETLGDTHLVRTEEDIQRDNKFAEQRKRRVTELKASRVSRDVPLVGNHKSFPLDDRAGKLSELEDETLGDAPLVRTEEDIQSEGRKRKAETLRKDLSLVKTEEDNRNAERRKRRVTELDAARFSRDVPLVRNHESIPRDGNVRKFSEVEDETLRDAPLVRTEEGIQRDNKVSEGRKRIRKDVCLVITEEDDRIAETMVVNETSKSVPVELNPVNETSRDELEAASVSRAVPLVRNHESFPRNDKVGEFSELEDKTLGEAPLARPEADIPRDNKVSEGRRKKTETLRIEEDNGIAETMVVNETPRTVQVTQANKGVSAGRRKSHEKSVRIVDKDYMSYLTWLVDSLKDSITKPISNLQKDLSDLDPPVTDTGKTITMVPEEDLLVEVKVELDIEPLSSDDSDIIEVRDSPFSDGEDSPFVASKSVIIDLDKETSKEDESNCWFRKELMNDLKRPYNEAELRRLYREASIHRRMTRCRELRKGRETDYETDELGKSYLERFDDFDRVYKRVDRNDKSSLLKLLRGFFFYLKNVSHDGAFKPWMDPI